MNHQCERVYEGINDNRTRTSSEEGNQSHLPSAKNHQHDDLSAFHPGRNVRRCLLPGEEVLAEPVDFPSREELSVAAQSRSTDLHHLLQERGE